MKPTLNSNDPDLPDSNSTGAGRTKVNKMNTFTQRGAFIGFLFFLLFGIILPVQAGFFSFLDALFLVDKYEVSSIAFHSQNVALPTAAINFDPNPSKGGGDITIVNGEALMPESGPLGTIADIDQFFAESDQISVYVVREGDSLSQIAKMFSVSTATIVWANDIKRGNIIHEGQTLVILPISGVRHTIVKDDTISSIATKYKADVDEILDYNELTLASALTVGDQVVVPNGFIKTPVYSSSGTVVQGTGGPTYSGYYMRPISGGTKSQRLHGYNAVDLAASTGSVIYASASGKVVISRYGWNGGYGNYIVIKHDNNTQTLYAHNSGNIVSAGQRVVQGQVIGYVGSTGRSTGSHVHFEVRGAANPF